MAVLTAIGLLGAGCSSPSATVIGRSLASPITVGTLLSLTGSQATGGQMAKEGYLYCQDWINGKGGINLKGLGHRLSLDIADDQSRPSIAASLSPPPTAMVPPQLLRTAATNATKSPIAASHLALFPACPATFTRRPPTNTRKTA